jgi:hypothetical protein
MPNAISPDKRSVTFLESRKVTEWMEAMARARKTDLSVILREATSAYYVQHQTASSEPGLFARRSTTKAAQRAQTARQIASGRLTPAEAQERNAPIHQPVRMLDLWPSIRRHVRPTGK